MHFKFVTKLKLKNTYYKYSYGKSNISKLSRKKIYYRFDENKGFVICKFDGKQWGTTEEKLDNYESIEKIDKNLVEAIAGDWKKHNIETVLDAMEYIRKQHNRKNSTLNKNINK